METRGRENGQVHSARSASLDAASTRVFEQLHTPGAPLVLIGQGMTATLTAIQVAALCEEAGSPLVLWVSARNREGINAALVRAAQDLHLIDATWPTSSTAPEFWRFLDQTQEEVLIVFDGATTPDLIAPLLPEAGKYRVIITAPDDTFAPLGDVMNLDPLSVEETIAYLEPRAASWSLKDPTDSINSVVLTARNILAGAYEETGRVREAVDLFAQTLTACEHSFGMDHPATLTARFILAGAYAIAGRLSEAIALYEHALAEQERVLGPEHPDTLTTQANLGSVYEGGGRLEDAIVLYEQTLTQRQREVGS